MNKTIMTLHIEKKTVMPRYNAFQTGTGVWTSEKHKKKGRNAEKMRKELKSYY